MVTAMLNTVARSAVSRLLNPLGAALGRRGVSPDAITVLGTAGVVVGSVVFAARGELFWGFVVVSISLLTDLVDGAVARATGRQSSWGAFLDSTMDRLADGAIFCSLAYWLATQERWSAVIAALACLLTGFIVSYAKARAEGLGMTCNVGIAERAERLIIIGVGGVLAIAGVRLAIDGALWLLTVLAVITIGQRMTVVWRQSRDAAKGKSAVGGA